MCDRDGEVCEPSSSSSLTTNSNQYCEIVLDAPVLLEVIRSLNQISPIQKILELKEICSEWRYWSEKVMRQCDTIRLEVPAGNGVGIFVQGSYMRNSRQALKCFEYILSTMNCLKKLTILFRGPSIDAVSDILDFLLSSDRVRLEVINVSGRRGGMRIERLSRLIAKCSSTLRVAGKIGLSELEDALSENNRLDFERLSLTSHDLLTEMVGFDGLAREMQNTFLRICERQPELHIQHLSVSAVDGFNPAIDPYNEFLKRSCVESLRVTLQQGDLLDSGDITPSSILYSVRSFEVDQFPNRLHSPVSIRSLFPGLQRIYVSSLLVPLKDLERAFAHASDWLTTFADVKLEGILTTEVSHDYDPIVSDKIRCHLDDLESCRAKIRFHTTESFCRYPTQFVITNAAETFHFTIYCSTDIWCISDIFDFDYSIHCIPC